MERKEVVVIIIVYGQRWVIDKKLGGMAKVTSGNSLVYKNIEFNLILDESVVIVLQHLFKGGRWRNI